MNDIFRYIDQFFSEEYELVIYGDYVTVGTSFEKKVEDSIPSNRKGLILGVAMTNTVNAEFDVKIEGKSALRNPINAQSLPANMELMPLMIPVDSRKTFSLEIRGVTASVSLAYRLVVLLKKR